jgi:archaellum component FlaC
MAIGWGKSFEEQVEEARQRASVERTPALRVEDRARSQRLESLKMSRSRIEDQLGKAVYDAHRQTLMKALQAIESEVEAISGLENHEH